MNISQTPIHNVLMITPRVYNNSRGYFFESYREDLLARHGITTQFIQDNQSFSVSKGVVRGMHFQRTPHAQTKLVRVLRGSVYDVVVDVRKDSPTYKKWYGEVLSAENKRMLYIPHGCAHGFMVLEPDTEVYYKVDAYYNRDSECGFAWNDNQIGIQWPEMSSEILLSEKDRALRSFAEIENSL